MPTLHMNVDVEGVSVDTSQNLDLGAGNPVSCDKRPLKLEHRSALLTVQSVSMLMERCEKSTASSKCPLSPTVNAMAIQ